MAKHAGKLLGAYEKINSRVQQVDANEEEDNDRKEFPGGKIEQGVKHTDALKKGPALLAKVERTIPVHEATSVAMGIGPKTGIVIGFGGRTVFPYRHCVIIYAAKLQENRNCAVDEEVRNRKQSGACLSDGLAASSGLTGKHSPQRAPGSGQYFKD
jgi:hypothetical protein